MGSFKDIYLKKLSLIQHITNIYRYMYYSNDSYKSTQIYTDELSKKAHNSSLKIHENPLLCEDQHSC
jgi:hypothetical protein